MQQPQILLLQTLEAGGARVGGGISSMRTCGRSQHSCTGGARDDCLAVGKDSGDVVAALALDIHEIAVRALHRGMHEKQNKLGSHRSPCIEMNNSDFAWSQRESLA